MTKTLEHVIPILVQIEENFSRLYSNVASIDGQYNPQLKTAALVLARQEMEHADYYRKLLVTLGGTEISIGDVLYYRIKNVLEEFKKGIQRKNHDTIEELLLYAIGFENRNGDVLRAIKNNVVADSEGALQLIELMDDLIKAEELHAKTLENFLPKKDRGQSREE
jgi:rubrerythrin